MKRWMIAVLLLVFIILGGCAKDDAGVPAVDKDSSEQASEMSDSEIALEDKSIEKEDQEIKEGSSTAEKKESSSDSKVNQTDSTETEGQETEDSSKTDKSASTPSANKQENNNQAEKTTKENPADSASKVTGKTEKPNRESQNTSKETPKQPADAEKEETAPPKQSPPKEPAKPKQTVSITISAPDVKGTILPVTAVEWKEGDTVLDITQRIVKARGIQISVRGSGATAYVEGIDNLYEFDEGPMSGWEAFVEGTPLDRSSGVYGVRPRETIKWRYTKNYLED
ncbi:DUF4430 domain-containing protein [Bacillus salacetis]|uniref:DUF4430 domain-containing protein n=1 Tax=Bacillus salacetis TaxID=2315464 RepID=A0A3A1QP26_9BACI|nr:DUF4430 domain-containing protein [Bacillus salacetis]RIW28816.1 DUF4430 domain-containing protein [Bacillus salacetis]